jgi:hypothetical protein
MRPSSVSWPSRRSIQPCTTAARPRRSHTQPQHFVAATRPTHQAHVQYVAEVVHNRREVADHNAQQVSLSSARMTPRRIRRSGACGASAEPLIGADRSGRTDVLCARFVREHPNDLGAAPWVLPRTCYGPALPDADRPRSLRGELPAGAARCRLATCQVSGHSFTRSLTWTNLLPLWVRPRAPVMS